MAAAGGEPASALFRVEVVGPSGRGRLTRLLGTLTLGLLSGGAAMTNAGGRRIVIVERDTELALATWSEPYGDDAHLLLGRIRDDLQARTADEFAERWIEGVGEE